MKKHSTQIGVAVLLLMFLAVMSIVLSCKAKGKEPELTQATSAADRQEVCVPSKTVEKEIIREPETAIIEETQLELQDEPVAEPEPETTQIAPQATSYINPTPIDGANYIGEATISHYCTELYKHACGLGHGITASGRPVEAYVSCAVDPNVIPLGSTVILDYGDGVLHYYRADDTGSGVDGNHVDLAVTYHDEALGLGIKRAKVWWK